MSKYKSILCPKNQDHKHDSHLLFVGKEELYVYCKSHLWIKLTFKKGEEKVNFENVAVMAEPMGEGFVFNHEPLPVLALGEFNLKRKAKEKRHGQSN